VNALIQVNLLSVWWLRGDATRWPAAGPRLTALAAAAEWLRLLPIPEASRRAEHVRPILDHASCDLPLRADRPQQRAFSDLSGGQYLCRTAPSM
jgi:hypothetical protein